MSFSPLIDQLIHSLRCLPGIGPKSAQRMAFQLLARQRENGLQLATALQQAMTQVGHCKVCRTFCEIEHCQICSNPRREANQLCVVETPADMLAIEKMGCYSGLYFVLRGQLSPIDGIGPEELGIDILVMRLAEKKIDEIILATSTTVEGEVTAHYISQAVKNYALKTTRLALGMPIGGELGYIDGATLACSFGNRIPL